MVEVVRWNSGHNTGMAGCEDSSAQHRGGGERAEDFWGLPRRRTPSPS